MIKPTIGRVVWYRTKSMLPFHQPYAAMVTFVHADDYVNLVIFDPNGRPFGNDSVFLKQEGCELPPDTKHWCEWMPYQIGQAKKEESK